MDTLTAGEDLIRRAVRFKPRLLSARFVDDAVFNLSMKDPAFKTQLFRFIDVLPSLKTREEVVAHLREYLLAGFSNRTASGALTADLPHGGRTNSAEYADTGPYSRSGAGGRPPWFERLGKLLLDAAPGPMVRAARAGARHMANTFIAGANLNEAMEVLSRLVAGRRGFCLTVLGEKTTSEEGAERYAQACLDALDGLAGRFGAVRRGSGRR